MVVKASGRIFLTLLLWLSATPPAFAVELATGKGFLKGCEAMGSTWDDVRCLDYLGGIFEGMIVGMIVSGREVAQHFCVTPDTGNKERLKYFIGFLKKDSWRLNAPTPNLFYLSLKEQYPCK